MNLWDRACKNFGLICAGVLLSGFLFYTSAHERVEQAQASSVTTTGVPAPQLFGTAAPTAAGGYVCNDQMLGVNYIQFLTITPSITSTIWMCTSLSGSPTWSLIPGTPAPTTTLDWQTQPGLFATGVLKGAVYYSKNATTISAVVTRIEGSPICTAAPTVAIMDLGTSATTLYASSTLLYSQVTATSNVVTANTGLSVSIAAGHFIGYALSAGSCVTPPTVTTTATLQ